MNDLNEYIRGGKFSVIEKSDTCMKFLCRNETQTENAGEFLARKIGAGAVVAFRGGMGAGKTALVRGFARGLGEKGRVTSPTYTIVNEYLTSPPLFHFDLYRLESADELFEIGFEDYLARGGICMIEWSENAEQEVEFSHRIDIERVEDEENVRIITITKEGANK